MKNRWIKLLIGGALVCLFFLSGALYAGRAARAASAETHQYKCVAVRRTDPLKTDEVQAAVDASARDGWRLASATDSVFAYPGASAVGYTLLFFEKK